MRRGRRPAMPPRAAPASGAVGGGDCCRAIVGVGEAGTPPPDIRAWLAANSLDDDFGMPPEMYAQARGLEVAL
jgi:hypothetical protein